MVVKHHEKDIKRFSKRENNYKEILAIFPRLPNHDGQELEK